MSTRLFNAAKMLEDALRDFSVEIAKQAEGAYEFKAIIEKTSYNNGPILSFSAKKDYESAVTGNRAGDTWVEFSRRSNWNEAHQPMQQLSSPSVASPPIRVNHQDDEIPF